MSNNKIVTKNHSRPIKSYVRREGRLTKSQSNALDNLWIKYGVDYQTGVMNFKKIFGRHAPIILDIGVGTGDSTVSHALAHPENNYLAVEVHRPGLGQLLKKIESLSLKNIKLINHDVIDVLETQIPNYSLSQAFIFFPDPWPKKRHHKRRLINKKIFKLMKNKLAAYGRLHIATDWKDYADYINELNDHNSELINLAGKNNFSPRPIWRSKTKYERRGLSLSHKIYDFCYGLP